MPDAPVFTRGQLLDHWLGHRRLTRRVIEAFPDDESFTTFSVGGMRPFAELTAEFLMMGVPTLTGLVSDEWPEDYAVPATRADALARWDATTERIEALWAQLPDDAFADEKTAFGQWTMRGGDLLFYVVDNEIHHRGQGYVYLRALGVEPPAFPDRS